jgi:hypothetical protein
VADPTIIPGFFEWGSLLNGSLRVVLGSALYLLADYQITHSKVLSDQQKWLRIV